MSNPTRQEPDRTDNQEQPVYRYPHPPFPEQPQPIPGREKDLIPAADHGEKRYVGHGQPFLLPADG